MVPEIIYPLYFHLTTCTCTLLYLLLFIAVCYVVGLGDRHIQNILIDKETAELIHIDLGIEKSINNGIVYS